MSGSDYTKHSRKLLAEVLEFIEQSAGLNCEKIEGGDLSIVQSVDGKRFQFEVAALTEVLQRADADGKAFIQINFQSGHKVLFTDNLVGFKPCETLGLDMSKIPRVVTTPDLLSVFEAIEDCLAAESLNEHELEILKKVFLAILNGAESAGFRLSYERNWFSRITPVRTRVAA